MKRVNDERVSEKKPTTKAEEKKKYWTNWKKELKLRSDGKWHMVNNKSHTGTDKDVPNGHTT